ncbi:MAG TPA: flagellar transcriptional regulator FlhC [Rhodocyclaceae bacterium]|nr:flagellar transcriptional regulator FlhC [Rhodocyclaceae bacterium]HMV52103.1 flagellar transcriptional regulator FlhC [Rhodocyclaceae bacterium]HMZ82930.1 flagellar transcriptional regulator FlhC [Rhodocyclaceae bacterium]HNA02231.1 flagellar transcriptional regulator FlhC [Rhodocyclaceae bacterium]HNB76902.1 flagellar transcriptional regulator FlhC [Rhodocyclaceae bacterium]
MTVKSVVSEAREIGLAIEMIELGARMQMLESEVKLSRERLLKLYKEVKKESPPKGMLPFSADWFTTWQPNIHSSLFMAFHRYLRENAGTDNLQAILKAYRLYLDHVRLHGMDCVLSLTRAWTLVRFFDAKMLKYATCCECGGHFVAHGYDLTGGFVCGLCNVPARAGKTARRKEESASAEPACVV